MLVGMNLPILGQEDDRAGRGGPRFWLLAVGLVLAGIAGYLGFVAYPRLDLPAGIGAGLLVLGAAAGMAAFFSPCSFPLLVTLLTREAGREGPPLRRAFGVALPMAIGATVFILGLGALVALGGRELAGSITFTSTAGRTLRVAVGSVLMLLGLIQSELVPLSFHAVGDRIGRPVAEAQARLRRRRPRTGLAVFGFGYLLAGFG